jgi:hypothetical protein
LAIAQVRVAFTDLLTNWTYDGGRGFLLGSLGLCIVELRTRLLLGSVARALASLPGHRSREV